MQQEKESRTSWLALAQERARACEYSLPLGKQPLLPWTRGRACAPCQPTQSDVSTGET